MTTSDNCCEFDDKISTANLDVSATQLLDDRYVTTIGKNTSAAINPTITPSTSFCNCKTMVYNTYFNENRLSADIFLALITEIYVVYNTT